MLPPPRKILLAAGNIQQPYDVLDMVRVHVGREDLLGMTPSLKGACQAATHKLEDAGRKMKADAVIHVQYLHERYRKAPLFFMLTGPKIVEVWAWGTAIKFRKS